MTAARCVAVLLHFCERSEAPFEPSQSDGRMEADRMKKTKDGQTMKRTIHRVVNAALWGALVFVAIILLQIPTGSGGYLNLGDGAVLLGAWFLGPVGGACAAVVGGCLADLAAGYAFYIPATLVAKAGVVVLFCFLMGKEEKRLSRMILSCVAAEAWMTAAYFLFEMIFLSPGAALAGLYGNLVQSVVGILLAAVLWSSFKNNRYLSAKHKEEE